MCLRLALIVFVLALASCGKGEIDPRLALCISATKQVATSPSSVKMVDFEATPEIVERAKVTPSRTTMDFEAANSYGAKLRGTAVCEFSPHPSPDRKGAFLLTSALIGKINLNDQQIAEANALDGLSRSVTEAMVAAEMVRLEKAKAEAGVK